ncbi:MAG: SH3 domain-containing protein [Bacteroidota bacterium]
MNGLLSRMEILVAGVLLLVFLLWAGSRCKETKVKLQEEAKAAAVADSLAKKEEIKEEAPADVLAEALAKKQQEMAAAAKADSAKQAVAAQTVASKQGASATPAASKLYITIDKLKIRSGPGLKSKVLGELPLFSEVYFMDEVTDSLYTVSLGKEIAEEPYIKVKTKRGTIGWVYGAGVNYYKKKREGVLE